MELVLAIATILGGITAIWFFWDKLSEFWIKKFKPKPRLNNTEKIQKRAHLKEVFDDKFLEYRSKNIKTDVIIRDVERADNYPDTSEEKGISSWFRVGLLETYHRGVRVGLSVGTLTETEDGYRYTRFPEEKGTLKVWLVGEIPFESIESVNWTGDEYYYKPHIYCHFEHTKNKEPYERLVFCEERWLEPDMRYFSEIEDFDTVHARSEKVGIKHFA